MGEHSDDDDYKYWLDDSKEINLSSLSSDILSLDDNLSLIGSLEDVSSSSLDKDDNEFDIQNTILFRDQVKIH